MATRDLPVSASELGALQASGLLRPSFGWLPGRHFRVALEGGRSLHLRQRPDGAWVYHVDEVDPARDPIGHLRRDLWPLMRERLRGILSRGG